MVWVKILNNSNGVIAISNKINDGLLVKGIKQDLIITIHYGVKINDRPNRNKHGNTIGMAEESFHGKDGQSLGNGLLFKKIEC